MIWLNQLLVYVLNSAGKNTSSLVLTSDMHKYGA